MLKKRLISLIACLAILANLLPVNSVMAQEEPEAAAADASAEATNANNYISNEGYKAFGLTGVTNSSQQPKDFTEDTGDPLANYTPMDMSELYVASMNRDDARKGKMEIKKPIDKLSSNNVKLEKMSAQASKNLNSGGKEYKAQNVVGLSYGYNIVSQPEKAKKGILESVVYVDHDKSYQLLNVYDKDMNLLDSEYYDLSDKDTGDRDWAKNIEADSSVGFTALATGFYNIDDQDQDECFAAYIPSREKKGPYIVVGKVSGEGTLSESQRLYLSDLNHSTFGDTKYHDWQVPVVSLATTRISGHDDLVINATLPIKDSDGYDRRGKDGVSSIYSTFKAGAPNSSKMQRIYDIPIKGSTAIPYSYERMKFASAYDADLNGNGVGELVVAGHATFIDDYSLIDYYNLVQLVTWDPEKQAYQYVWSRPQSVDKIKDIYVGKEVMEPAALTAGRYFSGDPKDYLFLEGITFKFAKDFPATANTEADYFKDNKELTSIKQMSFGGSRNKFVSRAVTGCFAQDRYGTEQTVVVSGAIETWTNYHIDYDVSWLYTDNLSNASLTQEKSNTGYITNRGQRSDGTFLTIADLNVNDDTVYFKYKGKQSGWSAPTPIAVLPATPHYSELLHNAGYKAGEVSFTISSSNEKGVEGNWKIGGGINVGLEAACGLGAAGNNVKIGGAFSDELMLSYLGSYFSSNNLAKSKMYSVTGDTTHVVCIASPVTSYLYDVWVPEYEVTQDMADEYKKETGEDLPSGVIVGSTQGGKFETCSVENVYDPQYSMLSLEEYNSAAAQYSTTSAPVQQIDMSQVYGSYTPGAPETYPGSETAVPNVLTDSYQHGDMQVIRPNVDNTFEVDSTHTTQMSHGFDLDFSASLDFTASVELSLFVALETSARAGINFSAGGGASWIESSVTGKAISATITGLPKDANAYSFQATPALWRTTALSNKLEDGKNPYVFGFLTEDAQLAPPTVPDMWVYDTQLDPDGKSSSVTLCWDKPKTGSARQAQSYEVYEVAKNSTLSKGKTSGNTFQVKNLDPGTNYTFQLRAYGSGGANPSALGTPLDVCTQPQQHPNILQHPQNTTVTAGDNAAFTVEATPSSPDRTLQYQWQRYTFDDDDPWGNWKDAGAATKSNRYTLENVQNSDNNTKVRVIVQEDKEINKIYPMAYSKEALLTVGKTGEQLQMNLNVGDAVNEGEEDMVPAGESADSYNLEINDINDSIQSAINHPWAYWLFIDSSQNVKLHEQNLADDSKFADKINLDAFFNDTNPLNRGRVQVICVYTGARLTDSTDSGKIERLQRFLKGDDNAIIPDPGQTYQPSYATAVINYHDVDLSRNTESIQYETGRGINSPFNISRMTRAAAGFELQPATVDGGTFLGWFSDPEFTNPVDTIGPMPFGEVPPVLYAAYEDTAYNITYHLDGGINHPDNPDSYTIVSPSATLRAPEKAGYRFMGWFRDPELQNPIGSIAHGSKGDLELYAKWDLIHYNIYYTSDGSDLPEGNPDTYTVNDAVSLKPPTGNGKWYSDYAYTQAFDGQPAGSTGTVVLYGKSGETPGPDPTPTVNPEPSPGSSDKPGSVPHGNVNTGYIPTSIVLILLGVAVIAVIAIWQYRKRRQRS